MPTESRIAQHTPAPWRIVTRGGVGAVVRRIVTGEKDLVTWKDLMARTGLIVSVWPKNGDPESIAENDANARLIAAAPDLLTCVKTSLEYLEGQLGDCDDGCECILHSLRAAIAKAEGEQ